MTAHVLSVLEPSAGRHRFRRSSTPTSSSQLGRVGRPEDIGHVVSFLVSEGAGFVSGQVIYAAGGPRA